VEAARMTIPAEEAASALRDAEAAAGRSTQARGYEAASGHLLLWGVIWAFANAAGQFNERAGETAWSVLVVVGILGSTFLGARQRQAKGAMLKAVMMGGAIGGFGAGVQVVVHPLSFCQTGAIASLVVGAVYMATGTVIGLRLSAVGFGVMVATVAGWLFLRDWFSLWDAVVGGGGLILGGLWMRKA
jgi:hypothetical protein